MAEESKNNANENDKGFNDDELKDIMNEIENLEKEFGEDGVGAEDLAVQKPGETALQSQIDDEVDLIAKDLERLENEEEDDHISDDEISSIENETTPDEPEPVAEEPQMVGSTKDNVIPLRSEEESAGTPVLLTAHGDMAMKLSYLLGDQKAEVDLDPESGLTISLPGLTLNIDPHEGCKVKMDHGIQFTVPLSWSEQKSGKKAA